MGGGGRGGGSGIGGLKDVSVSDRPVSHTYQVLGVQRRGWRGAVEGSGWKGVDGVQRLSYNAQQPPKALSVSLQKSLYPSPPPNPAQPLHPTAPCPKPPAAPCTAPKPRSAPPPPPQGTHCESQEHAPLCPPKVCLALPPQPPQNPVASPPKRDPP